MKIGGWGNVIINPSNYIQPTYPSEILGILYFRENNYTINDYEIKNLEKETKEIRKKVGKIDKVKRNGKEFPWKRVLRLEWR